MKIYTRTGDQGQTGLFGGPRVSKDTSRVEAGGAIDELNAALGLVRAEDLPETLDRLLERIQHELLDAGAELATPDPVAHGTRMIGPDHVQALEAEIDRHEAGPPPLKQFILPTGTRAAARLYFARAVCRRAERRLVTATGQTEQEISPLLVPYLNRLGDLLFVLGRYANAQAGVPDVPHRRQK